MNTPDPEQAPSVSITVAIPVFNEEGTLESLVRQALDFFGTLPTVDFEILVVDDGSDDDSRGIVSRLSQDFSRVRLFTHEQNEGFSAAQRSAYREANKDWVFILPADGQIRVNELRKFIPLCDDSDLILGRRIFRLESLDRVVFSRFYYWIVQTLFGVPFSDFGACWMLRKRLYESIELVSTSPVASTELLIKALMGGAKVREVSVYEYPRSQGRAKWTKTYVQIPRIMLDLVRLYRTLHDKAHPYHRDPQEYQRVFVERIRRQKGS